MSYPMKLTPAYKDYLWGGKKLNREYHKRSPFDITAESWEVSCHPNGLSFIEGGEYDGKTLADVLQEKPEFAGGRAQAFDRFPILIKLIDACDSLSIQVHPDDAYANEHENGGLGKTEVWYIVEAEPGAELVYGFGKDMTREAFRNAIETGTLRECLNFVPVQKGDVFFVRSGLLHAIGKGILICEIQQNSDTTYRVYDWDRVGADGKPRQLHIEQALDVSCLKRETQTDFAPVAIPADETGTMKAPVADCNYFKVEKYTVTERFCLPLKEDSFYTIHFLEGDGSMIANGITQRFQKGDSYFLPATLAEAKIEGNCEFLLSHV